jgi:hypothetical protein
MHQALLNAAFAGQGIPFSNPQQAQAARESFRKFSKEGIRWKALARGLIAGVVAAGLATAAIMSPLGAAAELARKHDFANVLCLAGRVLSNEHAIAIVKTFLENEPKQEKRFLRRIEKIRKIEEK